MSAQDVCHMCMADLAPKALPRQYSHVTPFLILLHFVLFHFIPYRGYLLVSGAGACQEEGCAHVL